MAEETWHDDGPGAVTTVDSHGNVTTVERSPETRRHGRTGDWLVAAVFATGILAGLGVMLWWEDPIDGMTPAHIEARDAYYANKAQKERSP
jgi:hypothetical protein